MFRGLMIALVSVCFVYAATSAITKVTPIVQKTKTDVKVSVKPDTIKVPVCDTLIVIKYDTTKITATLKDTTKVTKLDTTKATKLDTLKTHKK